MEQIKIKKKRVEVQFTEEEYDKLIKNADDYNFKTISEYVRKVVLLERVESKQKNKKLYYEINKIGVNLNQVARLANQNKAVDNLTYSQIIKANELLSEILNSLKR